jgi:hypothetical protein
MISQQIYHENKVHHIYLASTVSFSVLLNNYQDITMTRTKKLEFVMTILFLQEEQ